ncbi:hypothetical protein SAMN04489867_0662 [Pedococcus dokdonensis]|uniref:Uncharacterized protein n=1 Tax=Pedococcus dokdonensis TaxID=443156 RepID=A0A1H0MMH0_9MICO|nr:hypothetical protein [Pedococcus dokdonensis]SDO81649.1 hypothetical protein SAMN04489867_0662 [Pedococcus dokdonensis]
MATDDGTLIRLLVAGDLPAVHHALAGMSGAATAVSLLVAALTRPAAGTPDELLAAAARLARSTRDRQLVAITAAHLGGDHDRVAALVRDHLVDHPGSLLAAWLASQQPPTRPAPTQPATQPSRTAPTPAPSPRRDHV